MKTVVLGGKSFRIPLLKPLVGRELMTKGKGLHGLLARPVEDHMAFFSHISVNLFGDNWALLTTVAFLDNHVKPEDRETLLLELLEYNCSEVHEMLAGPTLADILWAEANQLVEDALHVNP